MKWYILGYGLKSLFVALALSRGQLLHADAQYQTAAIAALFFVVFLIGDSFKSR